jgi:hypothetical protein
MGPEATQGDRIRVASNTLYAAIASAGAEANRMKIDPHETAAIARLRTKMRRRRPGLSILRNSYVSMAGLICQSEKQKTATN